MTKKDFSHFKYYAKRLKEMGFRDHGNNDFDQCQELRFQKYIGKREYYHILFTDYSVFNKYDFPCIRLVFFRDKHAEIGIVRNYKIGFDKDFEKNIKTFYDKHSEIINEYPTWRSAFNQLVKDFHELEKNEHKRIHKGVSIHET